MRLSQRAPRDWWGSDTPGETVEPLSFSLSLSFSLLRALVLAYPADCLSFVSTDRVLPECVLYMYFVSLERSLFFVAICEPIPSDFASLFSRDSSSVASLRFPERLFQFHGAIVFDPTTRGPGRISEVKSV